MSTLLTFTVLLSIEEIHLCVQSGPVKKDRFVRPLSVYHSSSSHNRGGGGTGGGVFSVGRRVPLSRNENKREMYAIPSPPSRSLESPPPPPPSSPAPPLPPRVRGQIQFLTPPLFVSHLTLGHNVYTPSLLNYIFLYFFFLKKGGSRTVPVGGRVNFRTRQKEK